MVEAAFGDPNLTRTTRRQLLKLKQGSSEFYSYYGKFQMIATDTKYDKQAVMSLLAMGLLNKLKGLLVHHQIMGMNRTEFVKQVQ